MRSLTDRIRHMISFEVIALLLATTLGSWVTGSSMEKIGMLGVMFSGLAMGWNFAFNWMFDYWEMKSRPGQKRTIGLRVIHASLFELVLVTVGVFMTAWWLNIGYLEALILDIGFSLFFLVYAFVFNWIYDLVFPIHHEKDFIQPQTCAES